MDTGNLADDLLTQMYHNSKKAGAGAATTMPAAPKALPEAHAIPAAAVVPTAAAAVQQRVARPPQ
jgi:hypothetical protein